MKLSKEGFGHSKHIRAIGSSPALLQSAEQNTCNAAMGLAHVSAMHPTCTGLTVLDLGGDSRRLNSSDRIVI